MSQPTSPQAIIQFRGLLRSLVVDPMLLFAQVFASQTVSQVVEAEVGETGDRIYTPLVTLALLLHQILSDDHSCRHAVARLRSWRAAHGLKPCSLATGGYCTVCQRLPETLLPRLVRDTETGLQVQAPSRWLFHDRPVVIADGTTVSMPDTPRNQEAYPQHPN
jgi:hypothetical protein